MLVSAVSALMSDICRDISGAFRYYQDGVPTIDNCLQYALDNLFTRFLIWAVDVGALAPTNASFDYRLHDNRDTVSNVTPSEALITQKLLHSKNPLSVTRV